jgi:two-component system, LytTR family, sensor kinase
MEHNIREADSLAWSSVTDSKAKSWLKLIALAFLFWTALGVVFALPNIASGRSWRVTLVPSITSWWTWGLLTPLIIAVDRRLPFNSRQMGWRIATQLLLSPIFTALYIYLGPVVMTVMGGLAWSRLIKLANLQLLMNSLRGMFLWSVLVYCLIVGVWQAHLYFQHYLSSELRMERLERSFSEARLNALRMQLDPHFLFNALNTISSQVERDPRLARQMIEHLGDLLRLSLENKDRQEVLLMEELAFLDSYLAIQRIRFGDRLHIAMEIAPEVKYASVPCLMLQPLVENAIRHGLWPRASGGTVTVSAQMRDDKLEIRVADDGVGLPPAWMLQESAGLGLSVTKERISSLHPNGASFSVHPREGGGTEAIIVLPLHLAAVSRREEDPSDSAAD